MSGQTLRTSTRRDELQEALQGVEGWLRDLEASGVERYVSTPDVLSGDIETVQRLRSRSASSLINVALMGAFSSGKSFLLNGLQETLELTKVVTSDGSKAEK